MKHKFSRKKVMRDKTSKYDNRIDRGFPTEPTKQPIAGNSWKTCECTFFNLYIKRMPIVVTKAVINGKKNKSPTVNMLQQHSTPMTMASPNSISGASPGNKRHHRSWLLYVHYTVCSRTQPTPFSSQPKKQQQSIQLISFWSEQKQAKKCRRVTVVCAHECGFYSRALIIPSKRISYSLF